MEYKKGRCEGCKYARVIYTANSNWSFLGCTHEPLKGKWVAEIKYCPKENISVGNRYKDDEGFIWEVRKDENGKMIIECDDLMAKEDLFPRLNKCELIQSNCIDWEVTGGNDNEKEKIS